MAILDTIRKYFRTNTNFDLKDKKTPLNRQVKRYSFRAEIDMKKWREAVQAAENHILPRREQLYIMYHRVMEDDHLLGQVRTARFNIQMGDFVIRKDKTDAPDLTEFFDVPWFFKYIEHCVDTELFGHSLVELMAGKDNMVTQAILVPREHVRPEDCLLVMYPSDISGLDYINNPDLAKRVVEIGERDDLGLLKVLSKLVIRKDYTLTDWGRRNERFGMPYTILKTASRDKKELDSKEEMMQNFGSNMWAILDEEDSVELKEAMSNTGGGHKSFQDFSEYLDEAISILVNGQMATSKDTAYVGSSEVQERQLNKYTLARMRRIQYHINFNLIPHLIERGYPLEGCKFHFLDLEKSEEQTNNTNTKGNDPKEPNK